MCGAAIGCEPARAGAAVAEAGARRTVTNKKRGPKAPFSNDRMNRYFIHGIMLAFMLCMIQSEPASTMNRISAVNSSAVTFQR